MVGGYDVIQDMDVYSLGGGVLEEVSVPITKVWEALGPTRGHIAMANFTFAREVFLLQEEGEKGKEGK